MSYNFAFYTVHGVLKARILQSFAIPFFSRPCFIRTLHHEPSILVALQGMAHSFIELHKAVVHVGHVWLVFCDCGFSVCPPMPSLSTGVSLILDVGYVFTAAPAKCNCCSLPHTWVSSSPLPPLTSEVCGSSFRPPLSTS